MTDELSVIDQLHSVPAFVVVPSESRCIVRAVCNVLLL